MNDVEIVVGIRGDTSGARSVHRELEQIGVASDKVTQSTNKAAVGLDYFKRELANGQVTIQQFTQKMKNAGQSASVIDAEIKKLGITQSSINRIIKDGISPLEQLQRKQAEYNKHLKAGAIDQKTYERATKQNAEAVKKLNNEMNGTNKLLGQAKGLIGAYIGIHTAKAIVNTADAISVTRARVEGLTENTVAAERAMDSLRQTGISTGQALDTGLSVFSRLSMARDEIKATDDQMLQFTDTVSKLGVISGASPEALRNGLTQLGQALSNDKVRAEEFNSLIENTPKIVNEIAKQFNISSGELGALVRSGKVDAVDMFTALLASSKSVNEEFEKMPLTAKRGLNEMYSDIGLVIDEINRGVDGTSMLGQMFQGVGEVVKALYLGVTSLFDYMIAGIGEFTNGIDILQNKVRGFANGFLPNSMQIKTEDTLDFGSYANAAAEAMRARRSSLFMDNSSVKDVSPELSELEKLRLKYKELLGEVDKSTDAKKEQKRIQDQLTDAIKRSRTEEEQLNFEIAEMERLRPFAKTNEQVLAIEKNIGNARKELDKLRIEAELKSPTAKAFASLASEIDDGFKDAFKSAFSESDGGFKKLLDGWKNTFKDFLAELAYQAMARPIMVSVVGAVGGLMGLSSGSIDSVLGNVTGAPNILGGGTGGGLGNLTSIGSSFLNGGLYSQTLGQFGAGVGNLLTGQAWGAMGPSAGAAIGAGAFGNLGYGALGGFGASLLGLGSDNAMVNMATGTLGSLAGGAIGASMGTILGMAGGPIGAIAGGFLGTALGGLFGGGKPSNKTQYGGLDLSTLEQNNIGGMTGKKFSQQNADFRDAVLGEAAKLAQALQSVGGSTSGQLNITVGSRDGLWLFNEGQSVTGSGGNLASNSRQNFGNDSEAFLKAVLERVVDSTTGLSETFQSIVDRVGVTDTAKLGQALEFGRMYEAFIQEAETPTEILEQALEALNKQLVSLQEQAIELGLPIDELTVAYEKQKQITLDSIKAQMAGFTNLESMTKAFDEFLNGQALGANSSLSPTQKLQLAQDNFGSLLEKAQGGDFTVTQDLLRAANELLNIGRGVYASSVSFAGLEDFVRSSVSEIAKAAGVPGYANGTDYAASGLAMVGERGRELVQMGGGEKVWTANQTAGIMAMSDTVAADVVRSNTQIAAINQEMLDELKALRSESMRQRKEIERLNNRMAVKK